MTIYRLRGARLLALSTILLLSSSAFAAGERGAVKAEIERGRRHVLKTAYGSRELGAMKIYLRPGLIKRIWELAPKKHLLDAGSGDMSALLASYIMRKHKAGEAVARTTALGLERPEARALAVLIKHNPKHQHLFGKMIEEYRAGQISPVHIMVDQYGPLSAYSPYLNRTLEAEGRMLAVEGSLFGHFTRHTGIGKYRTQIVDPAGKDATIGWLGAVRGMDLVGHGVFNPGGKTRGHWFELQRNGEPKVSAPLLKVDGFTAGGPPDRRLIWDGRPAPGADSN